MIPSASMLVQAQVKVFGKVQGVFYRRWAQETAIRMGLGGWVRNAHDGAVELRLQGQKEDVEAFIAAAKAGPAAAEVERVDVTWEPFTEATSSFMVKD